MAPRDSFFSRLFARPRAAWKRLRSISFSSWLTRLIWVAIVVAVPAAIWALIYIPSWQVGRVLSEGASARAVFELENEARRTMAQIVLGVFGLLALFVTWRRTRAAEKAVQVAESGQQTERFTKAIEQLGATDDKGNPRLEIRLGGIYALERLARDSADQDYWTIMEVLTAYVRQNAPFVRQGGEPPVVDRGVSPRIDIQAILTVLGRRGNVSAETGRLDLRAVDIGGADLTGLTFERADMTEANLVYADLSQARLDGATLVEAHLERADLFDASLEEANLDGAHLERANLVRANLENASLLATCLENADLREADLRGATLTAAHLEGVTMTNAHLEGADLKFAYLEGADLRFAIVTFEQLRSTHGDPETRLPSGMGPPEGWAK